MRRHLLFLPLLAIAAVASAQSRWSQAIVGATNLDLSNSLNLLDYNSSASGEYVQAHAIKSFSGVDGANAPQTMTFEGLSSAQSNYGQLRTSAWGRVTNSYYNPSANAPYYYPVDTDGDGTNDDFAVDEDGSPDSFAAYSYAGFEDVLSFGQGANAGYKAQYVFFVHGQASGSDVYAYLNARIGNNDEETLAVNLSGGNVAHYWATPKYTMSSLLEQTAQVNFTTQFNPSVYTHPDGSTIEGALNFASTINLAGINVYDANDNLVSGITITGASGTIYPKSVPEPASFAALGLGSLALLKRRKRA